MPFAPDTQLGPYKIAALIGAGGMGEVSPEGKITIYPVEAGEATALPDTAVGERPVGWLPDGKSLLTARTEAPNVVYQVELEHRQA